MLKEVLDIRWDQTTAQIFQVHRVLYVSMAALPMNLNAKRIRNKKVTRIKKTSEPFLCNLGINGFHIESYGPLFKKSSPSQQCKKPPTKKKTCFLVVPIAVAI